ncbi:MAG: glycosyltransferase [Syntrophobacteraceae bacterium]
MAGSPIVTVITVNCNGGHFLSNFFASLRKVIKDRFETEIIVVDNGFAHDSAKWVEECCPNARLIENKINNYARALNMGIRNARGDYIALVNDDVEFHPQWLENLWNAFQADDRIGAVLSKLLLRGGLTVDSHAVMQHESSYFWDTGFGEEDAERCGEAGELSIRTGGCAMFRRRCLEDAGPFDEDFIMFLEDADISTRIRRAGWKIVCCPGSLAYRRCHDTTSNELRRYLCYRNRFLYLAKHFPAQLPESIRSSRFYLRGEIKFLYNCLLEALRKLVRHHGAACLNSLMRPLGRELTHVLGPLGAHNFLSQLELMLGLRKLKVGVYDHAFHIAGGGQRYVAFLVQALQEKYDVTYIVNKEVSFELYRQWFDIDLSGCNLKVIKIPFYERRGYHWINESMVLNEKENPFDVISLESLGYDVFINANMLGKVQPLSPVSVFVCHFPDKQKERFFSVDQYDYLVSNSLYSAAWIMERWKLEPTHLIYPPVDMYEATSDPGKKEPMILSVARFESGGSKKQFEMAKAFMELAQRDENIKRTWRLVLAGGNTVANPYFDKVMNLVNGPGCNCKIELKANLSHSEIKALYKRASIFWHACGLGQTEPALVEHFGMATVEAMQNYCVPIVINGGGQREIVQTGINGFTFDTIAALKAHTLRLINNDALRKEIAEKAYLRSHAFNGEAFKGKVASLFSEIESVLMGVDVMVK